jgi:antitoxin ParD1/3/4
MSKGEAITVELGERAAWVRERVASGEYGSETEVIQAGLEALEREKAEFDELLRQKIQEAYDDPRPSIPAEEVFERLRARHAERMKAGA